MLANRRNLVFRVSIVINIAVIFYAALHLSNNGPIIEWVPTTADGTDRNAEIRFDSIIRNPTENRVDDSTSAKTPSTTAGTKKVAISSTASIGPLDVDKNNNFIVPFEVNATNESSLDMFNEDELSDATLSRLRVMLGCNDKDFAPKTYQRGEYWVLKNYIRAEHGPLACFETVTYTTHAGFEFLDNVQPLVERWNAPISLAINAPGDDFTTTVNSIRYLRDCLNSTLIRQYVTFHLFFSTKHIPGKIPLDVNEILDTEFSCNRSPPYTVEWNSTYKAQKSLLYPVNVARNIARDAALTHYILPSDIELYPSPNLPARFLNMIARNNNPLNESENPRVFPLSLFEISEKSQVPSNKTQLQELLKKKQAVTFHKFVCPNCHNVPKSQQWIQAKETNRLDVFHVGKRLGKFWHWEPIFIGTHQDPYYDERLSWEGKQDKMTQGYVLCVKNYDFMILNNAFLIHKPGIKHYKKNPHRDVIAGKQGLLVKKVIMPELKKVFGSRTGCTV